jgi:hypothetical protein
MADQRLDEQGRPLDYQGAQRDTYQAPAPKQRSLGSLAPATGPAMPKQKDGESPSDYSERIRKWREGTAQKSAIRAIP